MSPTTQGGQSRPAWPGRTKGGPPRNEPGAGAMSASDEAEARRRHPTGRRWRTDRGRLVERLALHLRAAGEAPVAARRAAESAEARATVAT